MALHRQTDGALAGDDVEFGAYRLTRDGVLHCPDDAFVQLTSRLACIVSELARGNGSAISRIDLIERCWPDTTIGEESLSRAIADLRKIFRRHGGDCIETVYGLGYRLKTGRSGAGTQETISFCQEAWHRVYQRRIATLESADTLFTHVLSTHADHVPAWLGLAETQFHRMQLGYSTTLDSAPEAWKALDRALAIDAACSEALALKGLLMTWAGWDFGGAREFLAQALELAPDAYVPNQAKGWHELARGNFEASERYFSVAGLASPSSMTARAGKAFARMYLGDSERALDVAREMTKVDSLGAVSLGLSAVFEAALGEPGHAVCLAERSFELLPESPVCGAVVAYARARAGSTAKARSLLASRRNGGILIGANTMAAPAWVALGDCEAALAAIESGFANRCTWLLPMLHDPRLASLDLESFKRVIFR